MMSQRVLITGGVGTGKTAVTKLFGTQFTQLAQKRGINIQYSHVNCRRLKTKFSILKTIVRKFSPSIPDRGYSPDELLQVLNSVLNEKKIHLILTLDEIDYIIDRSGPDIVYDLTRLTDDRLNAPQRLSLIGIMREAAFRKVLDPSTISTLQHNRIHLDKYTINQLEDILAFRVKEALYQGVILDDSISLIADIASEFGDARYAIELLWMGGKYADDEGVFRISPEHVRKAKSETHPVVRREVLKDIPKHTLIVLLAISRALKKYEKAYLTTGEVESGYSIGCEEYNLKPRSHTQLWDYIQDLERVGVISTKKSSQGIRGKTTLISLPDVPATVLEQAIIERLGDRTK
jgi:cell division control protein 6